MQPIYITTPIYYANDVPHIGHAYTTVAADVLARFYRFMGNQVFFVTGTDEHGQKIAQKAASLGKKPQEHVDTIVQTFQSLWELLHISHDYFVRTTSTEHYQTAKTFFSRVRGQGDLYKANYAGYYCSGCEEYKDEQELVKGKCPLHPTLTVDWMEEENYFFRWSRYQELLENLFAEHPDFVQPPHRFREMHNFLKTGIQDIPVSRTTISWGIPVPDEEHHVIYVWFDALINYLTALGWGQDTTNPDSPKFTTFWEKGTIIHLMAKDIVSKHSLLWPAMLASANLSMPSHCFAHGFFTKDGSKISKSTGNTIDPRELCTLYGVDAFRYFFLREFTFGEDGDYSANRFHERYTNDLANDLGNLVSRTTAMVRKYFSGKISATPATQLEVWQTFSWKTWQTRMESLQFRESLDGIWTHINALNTYVDQEKPWALAKAGEQDHLASVLATLVEGLRHSALMLTPFIPTTTARILEQLGFPPASAKITPEQQQWQPVDTEVAAEGSILFPRVEHEP